MAWEGEAPKENKVSSWEGQAPKESSFSFSEMASNIPSSGVEFLKNMVQPLLHPIGTGKALGKTGMGFIEKLIPGDQGHEQFADSMLNYFTERYGGMDKFLKTVQNDPVGFAADLSTVFGGAGTALQASKIGLLSKAGKVASTAGKVLNPVTAPFEAAGGVRTLLSKTELPESIYARTMKMPPGSLGEEGRASVLQTLVREEKLPLGKNTLFKVNQIIKDTDKKIGDTLEALSQQGAQVDINVVVNALDDLKTAYKNRPNPQPYYDAIDAVKQEITNEIDRQIKQVEAGQKIEALTLEWDADTGTLEKMRSKETEADYRYFREHDLLSRDDVGGNGTEGYGERVEVVRRIQGERAQKEVDPLAGYDAHGQPDAVLEIEIDAGEVVIPVGFSPVHLAAAGDVIREDLVPVHLLSLIHISEPTRPY